MTNGPNNEQARELTEKELEGISAAKGADVKKLDIEGFCVDRNNISLVKEGSVWQIIGGDIIS